MFDADGVPDFKLYLTDSRLLTLEVKNVRSGTGPLRVESQKTRASRGDPMSRFYRVNHFEILAACLYNSAGRWEYLFARTFDLLRLEADPRYLATMQALPRPVAPPWHASLPETV